MSIFENDYNLPGVYTYVERDYSYGYDSSLFGTTDSVLIIGTAFDGPTGQVVPIYSEEHASYIFGKAYDSEKLQEASLVAGIYDAWARGCRTIYACRVSGQRILKDFNLRVDKHYYLRVMSKFPSNICKECYIRYDNTVGAENITLYKPATKATIQQRRLGVVESTSVMISTTLQLNLDFGLTKDTPLADVIDMFNAHQDNNVLMLAIVDRDGKEVTHDPAVRSICLGALYQGVYFIGRSESYCQAETNVKFELVGTTNVAGREVSNKPYKSMSGFYFHTLVTNTDIMQPYPIYGDKAVLKDVLYPAGITVNTKKPWEWLTVAELTDRAFIPDSTDYEEVNITGFDLYQRLGMGYAITAKAEIRKDSKGNVITPRVKETPYDDSNHIVQLTEGIYSVLQDAPMKYRVLNCTTATASTANKLPRAKDFLRTNANTIKILNGYIELTANVSEDDRTESRAYNIQFKNVPETAIADVNQLYVAEIFDAISILPETEMVDDKEVAFDIARHTVSNGTKFFVKDGDSYILMQVTNSNPEGILLTQGDSLVGKKIIGVDSKTNKYHLYIGKKSTTTVGPQEVTSIKFEQVTAEDFVNYKGQDGDTQATMLLGSLVDSVFVFKIGGEGENPDLAELVPNGDLNGMLTDDQEVPVVFAEDMLFQPNDVIVSSSVLGDTTFAELVDMLNQHESFGQIFTATLTDEGDVVKDELVMSVLLPESVDDPTLLDNEFALGQDGSGNEQPWVLSEDREIGYDYSLYIPYKTTDNFARQLAQHCTYTELKTAPTWGFIGSNRVGSTDLVGIANTVEALASTNFDLYAKNAIGRNMLDRDNMPYPIGRNVSIVFTQYAVNVGTENYVYYSTGAAGYAGLISRLPLDISSTNQPFNVDYINFNLTQYQHSLLNNMGIITLKNSFTSGIVVTDGTTMAPADSVFRRLSASRIIGAIEELIRAVAEPYIGRQNTLSNRNSLHTGIKGKLDGLLNVLIEDYQFQIIVDRNVDRFNYINIDYEIVPIHEIRQVRNRLRVVDQLSSNMD